jgi:NitT/TauT family transport system permease protein
MATTTGRTSGAAASRLNAAAIVEAAPASRFGWVSLERVFMVVSPLCLLVVWEALSRAGALDVRIFSRPTLVAGLIWTFALDGSLWKNTSATLLRLVVGMLVGVVPGLFLGLTMGLFRVPRAVINPLVSATYALPRIALFPLVLLIVGLNETSNIIMIALGPFFIMTISAMAGVRNVDPIYLRVARSFKVSTADMYTRVVLPAAMPIILSGLKLSLGLGLLGVISVEFLLANEGLGYMIWHSWQILSLGESMAGLLVTGVLGYAMFVALDRLEQTLVPWSKDQR